MDNKHVKNIQKRVNYIVDLLKIAEISESDYDSTQQPFFKQGENTKFKENYLKIPELPEGLNHNIKYLYEILGDPTREIYIKNNEGKMWTFMSIHKCFEVYNKYKSDNQERVFDIAHTYEGMGHISVLSCDLVTHNFFLRPDGGSNGYDRENNYKKTINYNPNDYNQFYFIQWMNQFDQKNNQGDKENKQS